MRHEGVHQLVKVGYHLVHLGSRVPEHLGDDVAAHGLVLDDSAREREERLHQRRRVYDVGRNPEHLEREDPMGHTLSKEKRSDGQDFPCS